MRLEHDPQADAAYLYLVEGGKTARTVATEDGVNLDFDGEDRLVGVEILAASRRLPKKLLRQP